MQGSLALFRVTLIIAIRNLFTHTTTTLIVGSIILFGTALVVIGTALLDSVEAAMERSITSSFAGHIQVYSSEGRDELALFGSGFMASDDIGELHEFGPVREALLEIPNVEDVVPMGMQFAQVVGGNLVDGQVEAFRQELREGNSTTTERRVARLRQIATDLIEDYRNRLAVADDSSRIERAIADLNRVRDDAFWMDSQTMEERLLFISTNIAPLFQQGRVTFLRVLGTDTEQFKRRFDRLRVIRGSTIPEGTRGLMLSNRSYEKRIKNRVARWIDRLEEESGADRSRLESDAELASLCERLPRQYQRITFNQDPDQAAALHRDLRDYLDREADLEPLISEFLTLTPANFDERREAFYELIAPRIDLYPIKVGDTITLRSFTQSGYLKSVNVKVWGVFLFDGLEGSELAGSQNLLDMVSFRELYGVMTDEMRAELSTIREEIGLGSVRAEDAEQTLFGEADGALEQRQTETFDELEVLDEAIDAADGPGELFDPSVAQEGLALNAAVILRDPSQVDSTMAAIRTASDKAGLALSVSDWQSAAGLVGQFVTIVRLVLYVAIAIIFLVALVIINNSMVMATMERVAEIGTMRAIGSPRGLVVLMIFLETLALGLIAGSVGAGLGAAVVVVLQSVGLPATSDVLVFLFSGPRLYPQVNSTNLMTGVFAVLAVSLISTWYPARIATRVQPVVAMRTE